MYLIPGEPTGNSGEAHFMQRVRRLLRSLLPIDSRDIGVSHTTAGVELYLKRRPAAGGTAKNVQRYRVKSENVDYLVCITWDGTTEGATTVHVAKPPHLRGGSLSTTPTSRTVNTGIQGAPGQSEFITPGYTANGEILAVEPEGGTGIVVLGTAVTWDDLNVDARVWAFPYRAYDICVNGLPKKSIIRGGAPY